MLDKINEEKNKDKESESSDVILKEQESSIDSALSEIIPDEKVRSTVVTRVMQVSRYSGPIPSPEQMKEYSEVDGALQTILKMARCEQIFRHAVYYMQLLYPYNGLFCGFLAFLSCIFAACFCAYIKQPALAGAMFGVTTLGVVGLMIKGRISLPNQKTITDENKQPAKGKRKISK